MYDSLTQVLIQRRSGEIMLLDVSKKVLICQIGLPKPLKILNGFCYAHATSNLYIRGIKIMYNLETNGPFPY